ncbi:DUF6694 family lipoprotein [Mixta intestinalis]|uniref:Lipoprotein n=1 Tax=Mixta intestinalis TaxID=1615494 RepID=A0A6P1PWR5_9GAMM|nr:DUF6694 family lipoprotein [Mixta intestinalis]QHM70228.1 hypothetical protein C7M51_00489 [Mixta intestinalis]
MKKFLAVSLLALLLTGCDKPTIDATTDETMKTSIVKVREALPENKRDEFDNALKVVALSSINLGELLRKGMEGANDDSLAEKMREAFAGKTGEEVIAEAKKIMAEKELQQ